MGFARNTVILTPCKKLRKVELAAADRRTEKRSSPRSLCSLTFVRHVSFIAGLRDALCSAGGKHMNRGAAEP